MNRSRIISELRKAPLNANQLSVVLDLNYKAIQHHLKVLERNNMVLRIGGKYGATFFVSPFLEVHIGIYEKLTIGRDASLSPGCITPGPSPIGSIRN